jgi:hypothetical protein
MSAKKTAKKKPNSVPQPPASDWRTTDQDEIHRRIQRAIDEKHGITNLDPQHPVFSNFRVSSLSGMIYQVEIRDLNERAFSCSCPDFRINGLGTCKHIEATLIWLKRRFKGDFKLAEKSCSKRIDIVPSQSSLRVERNLTKLPPSLRALFDSQGELLANPADALEKLRRSTKVRISQDLVPSLESRRRAEERLALRRDYETGVIEGRHPEHVTLCPLYPYQREGMLHLAFVLTGTPIENRIDELYSIVDFLDPELLGPLFRFNRDFYQFDEKGRPSEYQNLPALRERVKPVLLRRRKHHVETELPDRSDRNHFVKLTPAMQAEYDEVKLQVSQLVKKSLTRPLTKKESDILMILLAMMRMICDSPSIIKGRDCQDCPKLDEIARVLDECLSDPDVKVIIFSEWEGMLKKVRHWADQNAIGYAWHTGSVPQQKRRGEIIAFREDPNCRLFLSTDSGGVGLNLQHASVVINCDLPWNPARLEQRIARAWRKHQRRAVTVVNLIAENTLEHAMLETLANKMILAEGVLDGSEKSLSEAKLKRGREANLARLQQILSITPDGKPTPKAPPADPSLAFAQRAAATLGQALLHCQEAILPGQNTPVLLTVLRDPTRAAAISALFHETDWRGNPPQLQVLDESTWHAIQQLAASGLLTLNTRATRPLTENAPPPQTPALTPEQLQRISDLRAFAAKKQKVAQLLIDSDLADEAEPHQKAAGKALAEAEGIENEGIRTDSNLRT